MRIGVFPVMAGRTAGGPETYEHYLLRSLAAIDKHNKYVVFCLNQKAKQSFQLAQDNFEFRILKPNVRWLSIPISLPAALMRKQVDFYHATFVPPPLSPKRLVFTVHDLFMFTHPEYYSASIRWRLQRLMRTGLKHAELIICNSEHTKDGVAEMFDIPPESMVVTHLGVRDGFAPVDRSLSKPVLRERYGIEHPYFLFVGELVPRKNIVRTLKAFHQFRQEFDTDVRFVIAGKKTWAADEINETIAKLKLQPYIIELGYVPNEDLKMLYGCAEMLVFTSLSEGFGFPLLEAMACGTPVLTSTSSSMPEVSGDAAALVNPHSTDEIASGMSRLHSDTALRETLILRGLERVKTFTWQNTARRTLDAYAKVGK